METGFLNPIHDEEHFQSTFYNQGLNESDNHMLFEELIVPDVVDYDNLWHSVDDTETASQSGEQTTRKEDFKRILYEWQHQLNYMQEPEAIKQIVSAAEKTTQEVSEMFVDRSETASTPAALSIDELFPIECNKDSPILEQPDERSGFDMDETIAPAQAKKEILDDVKNSISGDPLCLTEDKDELNVDVETVETETPLLLAGDITSLLEQFEASEKANLSQAASALSPSLTRPSNQTIRDALPEEVINRIKATRENHKKMISVIPAMPNKRPGRAATRMQDAGVALSRNKLLKLVTGGSSGESVQLDHDYCTSGDTSVSSVGYYMSDSSEYPSQSSTPDTTYSRLPEFYASTASQKTNNQVRVVDSGSRKDSGLESGENSDEDVQSVKELKNKLVSKTVSALKAVNVLTENGVVIGSTSAMKRDIPMVSVLRKNIKVENDPNTPISCATIENTSVSYSTQVNLINTQEGGKRKKKLNLEEYRVRREERERFCSQENSRASSPISCTPPVQPDSTTVLQEGLTKEKPIMLSVEVQTQTSDFIDLTSTKSSKDEKSRIHRKEKRSDYKHRSYRSRHTSSSSSSSVDSDHRCSRRSKRRSRSNRHRRSSVSRMWSRSPSRSPSRSNSASSRSRSRSHGRRQKWRSRSPRKNNRYSNNKSFYRQDSRDKSWHRARSPVRPTRSQEFGTQEKVRQVEERRVIYVGRIDEGTTKADLRRRFQSFGPIVDISVHFRERGDNYGFVTFAYKGDAYKAVEHGNDDPKQPRYDLCFGGRRAFCKQRYADLDGMATTMHSQYGVPTSQQRPNDSFDLLLHEMKTKLRKRSYD